jgi:hypothetical protein
MQPSQWSPSFCIIKAAFLGSHDRPKTAMQLEQKKVHRANSPNLGPVRILKERGAKSTLQCGHFTFDVSGTDFSSFCCFVVVD